MTGKHAKPDDDRTRVAGIKVEAAAEKLAEALNLAGWDATAADVLDIVAQFGYGLGLPFTPEQVDLITGGEPAAAGYPCLTCGTLQDNGGFCQPCRDAAPEPAHEHEWIYAGGWLEEANEWCQCGETRGKRYSNIRMQPEMEPESDPPPLHRGTELKARPLLPRPNPLLQATVDDEPPVSLTGGEPAQPPALDEWPEVKRILARADVLWQDRNPKPGAAS